MAGTIADVCEGFFTERKAPWVRLRAGVVDRAKDNVEDDEHYYV